MTFVYHEDGTIYCRWGKEEWQSFIVWSVITGRGWIP